MPRIFDCFTYFNEDRLLELRFETLSDVVDVFVVVEATRTFTGKSKPLLFDRDRFPGFADRIRHVVVDDLSPNVSDAWQNEYDQRNAMLRGLDDAEPLDRIIVADLDEIPNPDAIRRYRPSRLFGTFVQRWFNYSLNNLAIRNDDPDRGRDCVSCRITTRRHLDRFFRTPQRLRVLGRPRGLAGRCYQLRRKLGQQWLKDGGWHFSWVMSPEDMIVKIESYSHTEDDRPEVKSVPAIKEAIRSGRDILGKDERFRLIPIDATFPKPLQDHPERYESLIVQP